MRIGFKEVSEQEQEHGKFTQKMDKWYYRICLFVIITMAVVFFGMAVYYGVRALQGQEDWLRAKNSFSVSLATAGSLVIVKGVDLFLNYQQKKNEKFTPEIMQKKLPPEEKRTLNLVLAYLSGRVLLVLWDIFYIIFVGGLMLTMTVIQGFPVSWEQICRLLIAVGIFACGHFLCLCYYKKRSFRKKLLITTKMHISIADDKLFCERLEESLKKSMRFYSNQLVVTDEFLLGYSRNDQFFEPAAIPREEIVAAEFYLLRWSGNVRVTKGVLACKLRNGFIVELYTARNNSITRVLHALDYCKVPYRYNSNLKYGGY